MLQTQRRIGYAVQGAGLFPHLTAEENICLVASIGMKSDWIKKRVSVLADLVNLDQQLLKNFLMPFRAGSSSALVFVEQLC